MILFGLTGWTALKQDLTTDRVIRPLRTSAGLEVIKSPRRCNDDVINGQGGPSPPLPAPHL